MDIIVVSPVLDFEMYSRCVADNPVLFDYPKIHFDNRKGNERISVLYNRFLDTYDYTHASWLCFCHEDFQPLEPLSPILGTLSQDALYGPIGSRLSCRQPFFPPGGLWECELLGRIDQSDKDGQNLRTMGTAVEAKTVVDTLDCQCLILHSSLVSRYQLRFDEKLSFDLYVEDFCATAYSKHGIQTRIVPFKCQHWSGGTIAKRFMEQRDYLRKKYPNNEFASSTGHTIGAGRTCLRRWQLRTRRFLDNHLSALLPYMFRLLGSVSRAY